MTFNSSKPNRNFVIVKFNTYKEALDAFIKAKTKFPSRLPMSEDLSKIEENTIFFQSDSTHQADVAVRNFLLNCSGAYPLDSGMYGDQMAEA